MPQRSNEFQQLIRRIYLQTRSRGARITESAMLQEVDSLIEREVDVLIEFRACDTTIRLAVECRDHERPASVEWIDLLIGKYRALPVHRIIAVSRAGFTKAALKKALQNHIETRTLREASEDDWPSELWQLTVARLTADVRVITFVPFTEPEWPRDTSPASVAVSGQQVAIDAYLSEFRDALRQQIFPYINEHKRDFHRLDDFERPLKLGFVARPPLDTVFVTPDGDPHRATVLFALCEVQLEFVELPTNRSLFGNIGVTTAVDPDVEGGPFMLTLAQEAGRRVRPPIVSRPGKRDR